MANLPPLQLNPGQLADLAAVTRAIGNYVDRTLAADGAKGFVVERVSPTVLEIDSCDGRVLWRLEFSLPPVTPP